MSYPHPGKFEGGLYATTYAYDKAADCLGESDNYGWYGLFSGKIKGRGPFHIIVREDSQGFVSGTYYDTEADLAAAWSDLEADYAQFCENQDTEVQS